MEIKPKMKTCPNGHYFNANKHSTCPLCSDGAEGSYAATGDPAGASPAGQGSFSPTITPDGAAPSGVQGSFSPTITPDGAVPNGGFGSSKAFDVPTFVGGDFADDTMNPVVGWLVCVEGAARGTDFRIRSGYNYIGRDTGDICIRGDLQVSRQNHAMVAFDESDCSFYVGPSAGRNLIKVNGKTVLNAIQLQSYDVISIGTTKLLFLPLCGEHFRWDKESGDEN